MSRDNDRVEGANRRLRGSHEHHVVLVPTGTTEWKERRMVYTRDPL